MTPEVFKKLQEVDWGDLGKRLLAFAIWFVNNYQWRTNAPWELPRGMTVDDIVQQVIVKTLSGIRQWDPAKGPLEPWLKDQIKSVIDELYHSATHRHEMPIPEGADDGDPLEATLLGLKGNILSHETESLNPESHVLETEEAEIGKQKISGLFGLIKEPELQRVLEAILDGCEPKPRFLSNELGLDVDEVNNRLKRIRRYALKVDKEVKNAKQKTARH